MMPELHHANGYHHAPPPVVARRMVASDIPWALDLADSLYGGGIDKTILARWGEAIMAHDSYLAVRSVDAVVIAAAVPEGFDPATLNASVIYFYGRSVWQVVRLLRIAADWAKAKGAPRIRLEDTTGRDISGIARRLGFKIDPVVTYVMEM